jgi:hypothetical protein
VLAVILNKEKLIRKELGVSVPVPGDVNTITQAVLSSVLGETIEQLGLDLGLSDASSALPVQPMLGWEATFDQQWQSAKENAKRTQTIFAQRRLKPEEVLPEWQKSKEALGSSAAVERLVVNACRRMALPLGEQSQAQGSSSSSRTWQLDLDHLPQERQVLRERMEAHGLEGRLSLSFCPPFRDGAQLVSRSHPLVVELADFIAERALSGDEPELAARSAVIRTKAVSRRTPLLLVRLRHQLSQQRRTDTGYDDLVPLLVEECLTLQVSSQGLKVLNDGEALELLDASAVGNLVAGQRQMELERTIAELPALQSQLEALALDRATQAEDDHRRVRQASVGTGGALRMRFRCEPTLPVDVIGLVLLLPAPQL